MIVHMNGYPGIGKLTIGRIVAERVGARLLDNHSIYNVALALTEFKSDAYYQTLRGVRAIAYERILELPADVPVILTNAHAQDSDWGNECWDAVIDLAKARGSELAIVVLDCSVDENRRRIVSADRDAKRKPRDPDMFSGNVTGRPLLDRGGDRLLRLDTTALTAEQSAERVLAWLAS
jgi:cytidylate kinase